MENIIGPTQSSFLKNKRASKNAIIVQEIIFHFQNERKKPRNAPKDRSRKGI